MTELNVILLKMDNTCFDKIPSNILFEITGSHEIKLP